VTLRSTPGRPHRYGRRPVSEQQGATETGPLAGVRVVELGLWLAAPACASVLADWGADVVKVEPIDGDPFRGLAWAYGGDMNPPFELDNRGKRSVAVDLRTDGGQEVMHALLAEADVFVTNYRPGGLERLGLDWPTLHERYPRLVYGSITGYGLDGPERDRAAYDMGAYWSRAGVAAALTLPGEDLPYQRGGFGDHLTGMCLAGGVAAALYARATSGAGQLVSTSLLRAGMYQMGADINTSLRTGLPTTAASVRATPNPLLTGYRCGDDEWIWLLGLEGDRHWPGIAAALDLGDLGEDPRFATMEGRRDHAQLVIATLQERFSSAARDEWAERLDEHGVWWAKVQHAHELIEDEQAHAAGGFVEVPVSDGTVARMVASPVDFAGRSRYTSLAVPELGQDTELVLLELGWEWERIQALKESNAII
jgi:crotonobetainyl-CoA:carnitine CoA-transferase CaiB-like acyl-CoA transferase